MTDEQERDNGEAGKRESASYPYFPLSSALKIAEAVKELGGAKVPIRKSVLASHFAQAEKSAVLQQRISAAKCFGLIEGRSAYTLTEAANRYFFPTTDLERNLALLDFLAAPESFTEIIKRFDGAKLPSRDILGNIFHREARVPESWKGRIAAYFCNSAELVGAVDQNRFLRFRAIKEGKLSRPIAGSTAASVQADTADASRSLKGLDVRSEQVQSTELNVWNFSYKGQNVRLVTPSELDRALWEKLNSYVQLLKPAVGKST